MTISINEIESGIGLLINGDIYVVLDYNHVKPGKGSAFVRVRVRNIKTGQVLERTFRSAEALEDIPLEEKKMQYLYSTGDAYHFMDHSSYEEQVIPKEILGDAVQFLQDHAEITALCYGNKILKAALPNFIVAEITHTEPGFRGDSTKSGTKSAAIETGAAVQVPLFINAGDRVKIDTRTGVYVERVQK